MLKKKKKKTQLRENTMRQSIKEQLKFSLKFVFSCSPTIPSQHKEEVKEVISPFLRLPDRRPKKCNTGTCLSASSSHNQSVFPRSGKALGDTTSGNDISPWVITGNLINQIKSSKETYYDWGCDISCCKDGFGESQRDKSSLLGG